MNSLFRVFSTNLSIVPPCISQSLGPSISPSLAPMISLSMMQHSVKTALKNECNGKLTPIIKSRVPPGLQMIFLASNRGDAVHVPPPPAISSMCRNWQEVSARTILKRSACFDIPCDCDESDSDSSHGSLVSVDDDVLASSSDFSNSEDTCDLELLEELQAFCNAKDVRTRSNPSKKAAPIVSRWETARRSIVPKRETRAPSRWESSKRDLPPQNIRSSRGLSPATRSRVWCVELSSGL